MTIIKCQGQIRDEGYSARSQNNQDNIDKYPWLAKDDPRRYQN